MDRELFEETQARLRELRVVTRATADGRGSVSFRTFVIESPFELANELNVGKLMAIETTRPNTYLVTEVIDFVPMHFGLVNLDGSIPRELRKGVLENVERSIKEGELDETWLEVYASHVGYVMEAANNDVRFVKGYYPPLPASKVYLFTPKAYSKFVSHPNGVRVGEVINERVELRLNLAKAIKYHIGVFAYTGSGKSNLTATLIRKALEALPDLKVVVIDVSMEYAVLLLDLLYKVNSRLATTDKLPQNEADAGRRLLRTHVIPEELMDYREEIKKAFSEVFKQGKIRKLYVPPQGISYLTYGDVISMARQMIEDKYTSSSQKPLLQLMIQRIDSFMRDRKLDKDDVVDDSFKEVLNEVELKAREAGLRETATIFSFISSLKSYIGSSDIIREDYDVDSLAVEVLDPDESAPRLFVVEVPNLEEARLVAASLINNVFMRRKKMYSSRPQVLFVLDEAQEFIPFDARQKDYSEASSSAVERLLRHGRKYFLHGLISTQRLAYLNTNVLQQIHTYFLSTLPRPYDRQLIAETFGVSDSLLDRTLDLESGQWLLMTFKSALPEDIPVFFKADNNNDYLREFLETIRSSNSTA
ncbi:MAG: ATP-binding protein [Thermoprotei archaeon]